MESISIGVAALRTVELESVTLILAPCGFLAVRAERSAIPQPVRTNTLAQSGYCAKCRIVRWKLRQRQIQTDGTNRKGETQDPPSITN
jgi:outer membrane lipopolysaccharide assembly protein LptE/RlpB